MNIIDLEKKHIMQTYKRFKTVFVRGEGCYLYDDSGKKYLDFVGGVATCAVGHSNEFVAKALSHQARQLISVSNLYYSVPQVELAEKLSQLSGLQKAFFSHSGADANEAAIKLAKKVTGKKHFIAFKNSFHGRTTGSLALTWNQKIKEPFLPLSPEVSFAEYGDVKSVENLIKPDTAAVFVEPLQGEAGVIDPGSNFLKDLRELCTKHKILLIIDEVQTGVGRTGKFFAYQHFGIKPDIVTLAKGLANGTPIGVCLSDFELKQGEHGATLGGNNLSCAAALATIDYIEDNNLLKNAEQTGEYFIKELNKLDFIESVSGRGLMIGAVLKKDNASEIVGKCLDQGLLCNGPTAKIIRFLPPLITSKNQVDECISILKKAAER